MEVFFGEKYESLLNELYKLTQIEDERCLTDVETQRYLEIVEYCELNEIDIDFAINL